MSTAFDIHATWVLLVGLIVLVAPLISAALRRARAPGLVGYLLLGVGLSVLDARWRFLAGPVTHAFQFLADLGVIALLFRVGLGSHPGALARKLPEAGAIWIGNVALSGAAGFAAAYYLLELGLVPSLIAATALTATSVGVAVGTWEDMGALKSDNGQLLLDVAELDDVSAVALMALLFALIPSLGGNGVQPWSVIGAAGLEFLIKFVLFLGLCYLMARYLERPVVHIAAALEPPTHRMLVVVGLGMVIAAVGAGLGFSLAIGALFAGLVFSRDPEAVRTEASFRDLYAFFTPFFFINIGLQVSPAHLGGGLQVGLVLLAAAVAGKFLGAALPALWTTGAAGATLLGVSLIPRAEIAMVVVHQGQRLGAWAVPEPLYAGMVLVALVSCLAAPTILYGLLRRWPQTTPGPE